MGDLILTAFITAGITALVTYLFWLKKRSKEEGSELQSKVLELEQDVKILQVKAMSEPQVRTIVSEEVKAMRQEISDVKGAIGELTGLIGNLRVELGILNYIKEREKE